MAVRSKTGLPKTLWLTTANNQFGLAAPCMLT
jgi:hypothetical protein